ncbi:OmpA family protein [Myroides sp. JBRI-B21084]|uniref:OmpA family protein n=1 Tax=Myroides sp. JBRI-B21084 TaxID=3119977 RepID=UPI0026E30DC2|nr:OmpA family protein [Paenimyroides cloacae]WKW45957.1 OmpA family protein [Paenimyroides cloacae]WKW45971.1 OmpA family protein [Paenimyroides cloacae]
MKKGIYTAALFTVFLLGNTAAQAQAGVKTANKQYDQWAYIDALDIYEKVANKGYASKDLLEKLGNAYYFNARYSEASKHYARLFSENATDEIGSEYYYRYAQTLQHLGQESKAKTYYDAFVAKAGSSTQIAKIRKNEAELKQQIQANSGRYDKVENLEINTAYADYGSYVYNSELYFTSARDTGGMHKREHSWTGAAFTSLYNVASSASANDKVTRLKGSVKSPLNESTAIITSDGNTMYFTRNNYINKSRKYDSKKNTNLKIYRAEKVDGKWENVSELPFNSDEFNTAHPTLSKDERTMYFSSDRPGGFGSSDLWQVAIHPSGAFGGPVNMGEGINTEARETFPYVTADNDLYFSSDGRVGLGGLDVYATKLDRNSTPGEIQNLGTPINSNADDFAYYIDSASKEGFFSSNRDGGKGNDDIYRFAEVKPLQLECLQKLLLKVVDAKNRELITDATVSLYNNMYGALESTTTYQNSSYQLKNEFKCGETYRLKAEKEGYITKEDVVVLPNESGVTEHTIVLEQAKTPIKLGDDLFKALNLNPIYFDLDKYNIRPDAAAELAKVLAVLEEYPTMKIDIRSHTDSRAPFKYNEKLSDNRAKSTRAWLIAKGISASRLTAKGYGERQLVNECSDGVKCTEEQHQANRRSEFIIVEM